MGGTACPSPSMAVGSTSMRGASASLPRHCFPHRGLEAVRPSTRQKGSDTGLSRVNGLWGRFPDRGLASETLELQKQMGTSQLHLESQQPSSIQSRARPEGGVQCSSMRAGKNEALPAFPHRGLEAETAQLHKQVGSSQLHFERQQLGFVWTTTSETSMVMGVDKSPIPSLRWACPSVEVLRRRRRSCGPTSKFLRHQLLGCRTV